MKITIEVDCSPGELRQAMGLPDLGPVHERYVAAMQRGMDGEIAPPDLANLLKSWAPSGENGLDFWRNLLAGRAGPGGGGKRPE